MTGQPKTRTGGRTRLAILVNTIAPYRTPIYAALAEVFETVVLHGGRERNRKWAVRIPPGLTTRRVFTLQLPIRKQTGVAGVWDTQYMHFNLGLLWWLPLARPGAVMTNELGGRTLIAMLYGRLTGVPVWVSWEGTVHSERHVSGLKRWLRARMVRRIRHWISYGGSATQHLVSMGVPRREILQVQNCVPQETFLKAEHASQKMFEGEAGPLILSVGQLIPRKGLDRLVQACGRLAARGFVSTLVLVGEGAERERLQRQAAVAGIERFHLLPNQSQEQLNQLYRRADVFVFPTLEDVWGLVVNEALWAGLPVLGSCYAGSAHDLLPPENLFDPLSAESFDAALGKVFDGRLGAADPARLLSWQEVSAMIVGSIQAGAPVGRGVAEEPSAMQERLSAKEVLVS